MFKSACLQIVYDLLIAEAAFHHMAVLVMFLIWHIRIDLQIQAVAFFRELLDACAHRLQQRAVRIVQQKASGRVEILIAAMQLRIDQQRRCRQLAVTADADIADIPSAQGEFSSRIDGIQKVRIRMH